MADFNFYLNTQGPRGPKGEKGDTGSPVTVEVYENTANSFVLRITDVNGTFLTPNLRSSLINEVSSGTYLRYDPGTQQVYTGDAEIATGDITGMVRFASEAELLDNEANVVLSPSDLQEYLANKLVAGNNILIEKNEETGEIVFYGMGGGGSGSSNVATDTRVGLVKPDNTTIIVGSDGTISAVGGGTGEGGTTDFNALINKPTINNETVQGNKSLDDYDIQRKLTPVNPLTLNEALSVNIRNASYDPDGNVLASVISNMTVSGDYLRRSNNGTIYSNGYVTNDSYVDVPYSFGDIISTNHALLGYKDENNNFYPAYFINSTYGYIIDNTDVTSYTAGSVLYQIKASRGSNQSLGTMAGTAGDYPYNTKLWQLNATESGYEVLYFSSVAGATYSATLYNIAHSSDYIPLLANINTVRLLYLPTSGTVSSNLHCVRKGDGRTCRELSVADIANFPIVVPDTYSQGLFLKVNKATNNSFGVVCPDGETIQLNTDGKLACNLDEIGGELNDLSSRVTALEDSGIGFEFGIKGDYSTHYGILDAPNGLLSNPAGTLDITLMPGVEMQLAGAATKTTNASEVTTTLNSTESDTVVFYVDGELLECGSVYYQMDEPTDGASSYMAWFNPNDDVNTTGQWQFKSNDTGNVWRSANATPIANITKSGSSITRIDYIGYRILDNDIYAKKNEALSTNQITNCITEIPNRIKVEKTTDGFVLKAGSQAIVPSGFEDDGVTPKFEYVEFLEDELFSTLSTTATQWVIYYNPSTQKHWRIETYYTESGASSTLTTQWRVWYDTTNNVVKRTDDTGATWVSGLSFPIMIMTNDGSKWTKVDNVFNGFGYIGQCLWADKGVKALFADGRNEDGTLKNKEIVTTQIKVNDETGLSSRLGFFYDDCNFGSYGVKNYFEQDTPPVMGSSQHAFWFNTLENLMYNTSDYGATWSLTPTILLGKLTKEKTGNFTSMSIRKPFKAVDYNELQEVVSIVETYKNGNSWYRVWSDGWVEQGGQKGANTTTITFLKTFKDYSYYLNILCIRSGNTSGSYQWVSSRTLTGATFLLNEEPGFWYACGYKA